jgi:hypothetical protein
VIFAKQKFSIFLLFLASPIVFAFALVENEVVSSWLLRVATRFVRIRTGLHIDAASWSVNPLLFSASLHDVQLRAPPIQLHARKISTQISPLSLLLGKISVTYGEVSKATLEYDEKLFKSSDKKDESTDQSAWIRDLPSMLGQEYQNLLARLNEQNLGFEELRLNELTFNSPDLNVRSMSLSWSNLGSGQARGSWALTGIGLPGRLQPIEDFHGALVLLQRGGGKYSLSIGNLEILLDKQKSFVFKALGGFPGVLNVSGDASLGEVRAWMAGSPEFRDTLPPDLAGKLIFTGSMELGGSAQIPASLKLSGTHLAGEGIRVQSLKVSAELPDALTFGKSPVLEVKEGRAVFVEDFGSDPRWKRELEFSGFRLDQGVLAGIVKFSEVGLCSLLESLGEHECFAGVGLTGSLQVQGTVKPLALRASLDLGILPGPITSDPMVPGDDSLVLNVKESKLTGTAQIKEDRVHLDSLQMSFKDSTPVELSGDVLYVPTQVRIKASTAAVKISSVADEVVGLAFTGTADIDSQILYDQRQPKQTRTRVINKMKISQFGMDSEIFGSVSGNLDYTDRSLRLGPFQIRNGGGVGRLSGSVANRADGSYLDLDLNLDRLEYRSSNGEDGKPYFTGFLTGGGRMSGYTAPKDGQRGLGADIEIVARNFDAFGIPFQKASLSGTYVDKVLNIDSFRAIKDSAWLELSGNLNPEGGSIIKFWSDRIPIKNIPIDPGLAIFDSGRVEVQGKWQPSVGWNMEGRLTELYIAGQPLPTGQLKLSSEKNEFRVGVDISTLLKFSMKSVEKSGRSYFEEMEVSLKDRGLYAGFAYLGGWLAAKPFLTSGSLAFRWTPREGYFRSSGLAIQGPVGETGRILDLVTVPGKQELSWKDQRVVENNLQWSGPSELNVEGKPGESQLTVRGKLLAPFLGLFVPGLNLVDGYLEGQAVIPLSPNFDTLRLRGNIVNGGVLIPGLSEPFTALKGRIQMQEGQVQLQDITGSAGAGRVSLAGVYKLDARKSGAAIQADLQQARTVVLDDVPVELTGTLNFSGENPPYLLSGRLQVANALYSKEFKPTPPPGTLLLKKTPFIKFDIDMNIEGSSRVANSLISSGVVGDMRLSGSELDPIVLGEIDLKDGSIFANQNEFKISHGRVYIPADPAARISLNLRAQTEVKYSLQTYRIEMNARGPVDNLEIDLTSDPPLGRPDIISLLAFGVIRDADRELNSDQLFSAAQAEAFQSVFGKALGSNINKTTGFLVRLKPGVQQQQGNENLPNVSVVRKLSDKVTAKFGRSLNLRNPEKDFEVDYEVMKNINVIGVWESPEEDKSSLGVDLRFRIDIK